MWFAARSIPGAANAGAAMARAARRRIAFFIVASENSTRGLKSDDRWIEPLKPIRSGPPPPFSVKVEARSRRKCRLHAYFTLRWTETAARMAQARSSSTRHHCRTPSGPKPHPWCQILGSGPLACHRYRALRLPQVERRAGRCRSRLPPCQVMRFEPPASGPSSRSSKWSPRTRRRVRLWSARQAGSAQMPQSRFAWFWISRRTAV
jgi:hypothetical protein